MNFLHVGIFQFLFTGRKNPKKAEKLKNELIKIIINKKITIIIINKNNNK